MPRGIGYGKGAAKRITKKAMPKRPSVKTGRKRPRISVALRGKRRKF
jgi:hypothetical protein